jgi:methionine synthase / methylenetetrahydrofolate reductase(NADPH)
MKLKDYLKEHRLIPDGSMGTYYSSLVNQPGAMSEFGNLSSPDIIKKIHQDYIQVGARILRTNTFAANREVLRVDTQKQIELVEAACQIAKKAVEETVFGRPDENPVWILGDIGPIPENADTQESEVLEEYRLLCNIFIREGLAGIHFETFSDTKYIEKLVPYIKEQDANMFILTSFSVNKNGYTGSGISANRLMDKLSKIEGIDGCGLNCGIGSGHMYQILQKVNFPINKYIYAAPNAGYPEQMQNRMVFMDNADYFTGNMKRIAALGVDIIGGCCGTTPDYIAKLINDIDLNEHASIRKTSKSGELGNTSPIRGNDFCERLQSGMKVIAVELDPPYDADVDQIIECAHSLKASNIDMITFADSPMGRSRVDSILMSIKIADETGMNVMPHVCCRDRNMISMRSSLLGAYIHGIRNLLIVTGDPVPGESRLSTTGVFDYNSMKLMDYVKEMNVEHFAKEPIYYGGALNYGRGMIDKIAERMKRKIEAGASYFLTQPIYAKEDVERIKSLKEMVDTKILCGIMPLVSYRNANFIKNEISGIYVPDEIVARYHPEMTKEEAENVGAAIAREIMELLEPIADGYYFMLPFNRVSLIEKILRR